MSSSGSSSSHHHDRHPHYGDRFIPNRASVNLDIARYSLDLNNREKGPQFTYLAQEEYRRRLADLIMVDGTRILSFWNRPYRAPITFEEICRRHELKWKPRYISKAAEKTLYAPGIIDDHCLNLLDWSSTGVVAIALGNRVCFWDASNENFPVLSVDEENGPITSISWAPYRQNLAVGINNATVEIWDMTSNQKLRTLQSGHRARVSSLSWNDQILTTGGKDSMIIDHDLRTRSHIVKVYKGHEQEVCGLKWSDSGKKLASGGDDNLLYIWDCSMASTSYHNRWLHKFESHVSSVKALSWCPLQRNLLASGGGVGDHCIKFWNTQTGVCLNSFNTGSEIYSLLWSKSEKEILSSHGCTQNQLTLWKYPSMVKIAELNGHTSRVLFMTQSPDGCKVASAAGDETLRFWNVFENPEVANPTMETTNAAPFSNSQIR